MISAIIKSTEEKEIDGMQFSLTTRLPYLTIVSPSKDILHKCVLLEKRKSDTEPLIYEHQQNIGIRLPYTS